MEATGRRTVSRPSRIGSTSGNRRGIPAGAARDEFLRVELAGAGDAREQRDQLLAVLQRPALRELVAHVRERALEPLVHQRLQQVVERVRVEGVDRVAVEGGHEYDHRHAGLRDAAQHLESVDARHLDVEEHEVRRVRGDRVDRLAPVRALRDDLEVVESAQAELEPAPRERLVVDDDCADRWPSRQFLDLQRQAHLDAKVPATRPPPGPSARHRTAP